MSFMTAMLLLVDPTKRLSQVNASLQNGIAAGASIFQFIDAPDEEDKGTYHTARVKGDISIEQLHFAYPEKASVIKGLSLNIAAGEKIALVGQSGSGKTTLMQLLPRFYSLTQGSIKIDDVDVCDYRLSNLRAQFAYVGQDVQLFNASVKDNICYAAAYDEARMIEAAEKAHAHEFITQLTDGYQQAIGENGNSLSGGQKQRLALARAFYSDAPILLLDEATSALDANSEERVQQALSELMQGRTTVMIAHRLSSIEGVDRIIVMEQGQIIEQGSHAALMAKKHAYYQLVQKQMAYVAPSAST